MRVRHQLRQAKSHREMDSLERLPQLVIALSVSFDEDTLKEPWKVLRVLFEHAENNHNE